MREQAFVAVDNQFVRTMQFCDFKSLRLRFFARALAAKRVVRRENTAARRQISRDQRLKRIHDELRRRWTPGNVVIDGNHLVESADEVGELRQLKVATHYRVLRFG